MAPPAYVEAALDRVAERPWAAFAALGSVACGAYAVHKVVSHRRRSRGGKPTSLDLSGGFLKDSEVAAEFGTYSAAFSKASEKEQLGMVDKQSVASMVNTFYSLVTDIYEWGWGTSFHFSPQLPGKDVPASEAAHEARVAALLGLQPGMQCLDAGCGVGGPMRTIAATSGAHVVGLTINDYQVERATHHNEKLGLSSLCSVVQGNFLSLPFEPSTFDGAYAIEATCHAPNLEDVYAQIYRSLKPGARFVSYEWVTTKLFDPANAEHAAIIDGINYGNGLPDMRTAKQAEDAGRKVGFKLVASLDMATASEPCGPWYHRLTGSRTVYRTVNQAIINTLCALRIAPRGLGEVHDMLLDTVDALVAGGSTGIFSPMHMLVFEKPL